LVTIWELKTRRVMFRQTIIKLTGLYLAIMMLISLFFSAVLYQTSIEGLTRDFNSQADLLMKRLPGLSSIEQYIEDRRAQLEDEKFRLIGQLIITNVVILGLGGLTSYLLARRTLAPIEEAHNAQLRFTADASHELRTPLAVMRTEIEVALMDPKLDLRAAKTQLRSNLEELSRLTRLSEGLLRLARSDHEAVFDRLVSLQVAIQVAVADHQKAAGTKHIQLEVREQTRKLRVLGDEASLSEAISILIDNAIKYCPSGTVVTITTTQESGRAIIRVADNGPGISAQMLPRLFERFYRGDSSRTKKRHSDGYGLGLAIAQSIIQTHHGQIDVASVTGKGTTFAISLPL